MPSLTIHGTPISTYVRTVRLLLEEIGTDYTLKSVNILNGECSAPEYLAKNPFGKVPTLEVDGAFIYETTAITRYLDRVIADQAFTPQDPLLAARMDQIVAIIDSYLYKPAIHSIVIERFIVPTQGGKTDEDKVKAAIAPVKTALDAIESITLGTPYLLGESLTLADLFLIPIFWYFSNAPEFEAAIADAPKLKAWWSHVKELPNVKKICS